MFSLNRKLPHSSLKVKHGLWVGSHAVVCVQRGAVQRGPHQVQRQVVRRPAASLRDVSRHALEERNMWSAASVASHLGSTHMNVHALALTHCARVLSSRFV